jgi:hypothetical protein
MSKLRIIVTGLIGQYPLGGVSWDYIQYAAGLMLLGHDVYYIEDTGQHPFNPLEGGVSRGCDFNIRYLNEVMSRFAMEDRWAYHFPWKSQWFGLADNKRQEVIQSADILINVSGVLAYPEKYRHIPCLVYIDSDPVFTQIKLAKGQTDFRRMVEMHDVHFSFGEQLSDAVPKTAFDWRPTRQPVVLDEWRPGGPARDVYTTVMNWTSYKPLEFKGRNFAQQAVEIERFIDLPAIVPDVSLEIAVNTGKTRRTPRELLARKGWHVVHPDEVCPDMDGYRSYITSSRAEWSVAKNGYVAGSPGWFSCRSACYLAAGRPVVLQDTGFSGVLPTGTGIVSFSTLQEAVDGILDVESRYESHCREARDIAEAYFDSSLVLSRLLDESMASAAGKHPRSMA